jgi:O-methyltransferase
MGVLKRIVRGLVNRVGYDIQRLNGDREEVWWTNPPSTKKHTNVRPTATYSPWVDDVEFQEAYRRIKGNTLVDIYRCYELWDLVRQTRSVEGDVLEVGVWRGGTGALLAQAVRGEADKRVFLADTFTGVVKAGNRDTRYKGGEHADTTPEIVRGLLDSFGLRNVDILEGVFPEDAGERVPKKLAFVHCDVDVYASTKDSVEWCIPRLSVNGIMVFDDYGFWGCEGVATYCEELRERTGFRFLHNLNGHAVFLRIG